MTGDDYQGLFTYPIMLQKLAREYTAGPSFAASEADVLAVLAARHYLTNQRITYQSMPFRVDADRPRFVPAIKHGNPAKVNETWTLRIAGLWRLGDRPGVSWHVPELKMESYTHLWCIWLRSLNDLAHHWQAPISRLTETWQREGEQYVLELSALLKQTQADL